MNAVVRVALAAAAMLGSRAPTGQTVPTTALGAQRVALAAADSIYGAEAAEPGLGREVFAYPGGERRDPFHRPLPGDAAGPRFEELRLIGVVHSPNPRESVALVVLTMASSVAAAAGEQTLRLRQDAVVGDMKVVGVERDHLVFEINRLGVREQLELPLERLNGRDGR